MLFETKHCVVKNQLEKKPSSALQKCEFYDGWVDKLDKVELEIQLLERKLE